MNVYILLDRSGSMDALWSEAVGSINDYVAKLDKKDLQYMRDLQINDLPSYKNDKLRKGVEDRNQQWRADSAKAYRAKQDDKLKKMAGGLDIDKEKIKNYMRALYTEAINIEVV